MKKIIIFQCLLTGIALTLGAQSPAKYWVQFRDKANSPYSIERPEEFLSPRAISLRTQHRIAIEENDLPVNPQYVRQVLALDSTMRLLTKSKWLNGITVYAEQDTLLEAIRELPCVSFAERTAALKAEKPVNEGDYTYSATAAATLSYQSDVTGSGDFDYGKSAGQVRLNNAHWLHRMGFRGEHVRIMVMDVGFGNVDTLHYFENLRSDNRLLGARDLVQAGETLFRKHTHGTMVLSCIASYTPGEIVGTAPMAEIFLCKTEDSRSETKAEEDNWVAGIELADSLGCQLLNSSVGYTRFSDTTQHRQYADLNGKVSRASIAATTAATKGMIVCNSAGNEGGKPWKHIIIPADARDILTVGGVNMAGKHASFSSYGPTADGRIKPDACAMARHTYVASTHGIVIPSNGTSFSSPLLCGMTACLREAFPDKSNYEIIQAIRESGSHFNCPDSAYGYGITDFLRAYNLLLQPQSPAIDLHFASFVPKNGKITIETKTETPKDLIFTISLRHSKKKSRQTFTVKKTQILTLRMPKLPRKTNYDMADISIHIDANTELHFVAGIENVHKEKNNKRKTKKYGFQNTGQKTSSCRQK